MFTRLFSLLTTNIFIPNYLNVLDRENDIIKCQILVEIIIIEDNIFHLLWRICVISFISIIYRFQTKWLPRRRRSRTRSPLVCIYISLRHVLPFFSPSLQSLPYKVKKLQSLPYRYTVYHIIVYISEWWNLEHFGRKSGITFDWKIIFPYCKALFCITFQGK